MSRWGGLLRMGRWGGVAGVDRWGGSLGVGRWGWLLGWVAWIALPPSPSKYRSAGCLGQCSNLSRLCIFFVFYVFTINS